MSARRLYTSEQAAAQLQCKPSWLEDQARQRRIPFTMIGGSYRFSDEHITEIIRIFECRPEAVANAPRPSKVTRIFPSTASTDLKARTPRRKRTTRTSAG